MEPSDPAKPTRWPLLPFFLGLLLIGAAWAYHSIWHDPFIFDDRTAIPENPTLHSFRSALSPPADTTVSGRPLVNLSFALNRAIGGMSLPGYHLTNLVILLAGAWLLFGLVRRILRRNQSANADAIAAAAALLWALHPLQTESVTYLVQRAESLMGLWYLGLLYCVVRSADAERDGRNFRGWSIAAVIFCWLGMATKEVMVSAPVIAFALDRTCLGGSWGEAWRRRRWMYVAMAFSWIALALLVASTHGRSGTAGFGLHLSWARYLRTQAWGVLHYLRLSFFPAGQIFDYGSFWVDAPRQWLPATVAVLVLAGVSFWAFWRGRIEGWLAAWFFAVLAPTSLVPGARETLAEHRMYLAWAPVAVLAVTALFRWLGARAAMAVGLIFVVGLAAAAEHRNRIFQSDRSVWLDTIAKLPRNEYAQDNVGVSYLRTHEERAAIPYFQASLAIRPDFTDALLNLAVAQMVTGDVAGGVAALEAVLRTDPASAPAHNNYGKYLREAGRPAEALPHFDAALATNPEFPDAQNNYGNALADLHRYPEAETHFRAALRSQPENAQAHDGLGLMRLRQGHPQEARAEFAAALRLDPALAVAYANDGEALLSLGRKKDADRAYARAEELDPQSGDIRYNHANLLFKAGRLKEALELYNAVVRLKPTFALGHYNRAITLYQLGQIPTAIEELETAQRLAPDLPGLAASLAAARARIR